MPEHDETAQKQATRRRRIALLVLLALAAFMYTSIAYKIINYGP